MCQSKGLTSDLKDVEYVFQTFQQEGQQVHKGLEECLVLQTFVLFTQLPNLSLIFLVVHVGGVLIIVKVVINFCWFAERHRAAGRTKVEVRW